MAQSKTKVNEMPHIDIIADGVADNANPKVMTVINAPQQIEAIHFNGKNKEAIIEFLKSGDVEWEQAKDGTIKVAFWRGDKLQLKETDWLVRYDDGSYGFIADKEFRKTYVPEVHQEAKAGKPLKFNKLIIASNIIPANEPSKELFEWLVDKNGKPIYRELKDKSGIQIKSKEGWQTIKWGEHNYIIKDTTGDFYPKSEKNFKKFIVLNFAQELQVKWMARAGKLAEIGKKQDTDISKVMDELKTTNTSKPARTIKIVKTELSTDKKEDQKMTNYKDRKKKEKKDRTPNKPKPSIFEKLKVGGTFKINVSKNFKDTMLSEYDVMEKIEFNSNGDKFYLYQDGSIEPISGVHYPSGWQTKHNNNILPYQGHYFVAGPGLVKARAEAAKMVIGKEDYASIKKIAKGAKIKGIHLVKENKKDKKSDNEIMEMFNDLINQMKWNEYVEKLAEQMKIEQKTKKIIVDALNKMNKKTKKLALKHNKKINLKKKPKKHLKYKDEEYIFDPKLMK